MCFRSFFCGKCESESDIDEYEYSALHLNDDEEEEEMSVTLSKKKYRVISYSCKKNGIRLHSNALTYKKACDRVAQLNNQMPYVGWKRRPYYIVTVNHV